MFIIGQFCNNNNRQCLPMVDFYLVVGITAYAILVIGLVVVSIIHKRYRYVHIFLVFLIKRTSIERIDRRSSNNGEPKTVNFLTIPVHQLALAHSARIAHYEQCRNELIERQM